jgi:hypothetical protein
MQSIRCFARAFLTLSGLVFVAGGAFAGRHDGVLGVSAQVVAPHRPELARDLPMPAPGHVMQDDARGLHYFFEGDMQAASMFLDREMRLRGYALSAHRDTGQTRALRWERGRDIVDVELRAARGTTPTRMSVRATSSGLSSRW